MAESVSGIHHTITPDGNIGAASPKWQDCLASPTPFCLYAFALTALLNGAANAHWIDPVRSLGITLSLTLFLGGTGLILGGVVSFIKGDTFGFAVWTMFGYWHLAYATSVIFPNKGIITTGPVDTGTYAAYMFCFLLLSIMLWTYTFKRTGAFTILFAVVLVVFILLGVGFLVAFKGYPNASTTVLKVEGYVVMGFALFALYLATAELNSWYPYPTVVVAKDPVTGEVKGATVTGVIKTTAREHGTRLASDGEHIYHHRDSITNISHVSPSQKHGTISITNEGSNQSSCGENTMNTHLPPHYNQYAPQQQFAQPQPFAQPQQPFDASFAVPPQQPFAAPPPQQQPFAPQQQFAPQFYPQVNHNPGSASG